MPEAPSLDAIEALKHIKTLARAALENGESAVAQEHLTMILTITDRAIPQRSRKK